MILKKIMNYEVTRIKTLLDELIDLQFYFNNYGSLLQHYEQDRDNEYIIEIIRQTHQIKNYLLNIFWKEKPIKEYNEMYKLLFLHILRQTIKLLILNFKDKRIHHYYCPTRLIFNGTQSKTKNFLEKRIIITCNDVIKKLSPEFVSKNNIYENDNDIDKSINMTSQLFDKLKEDDNFITSLKTTVKQVDPKLNMYYTGEIKNLF